MKVFGFFRSDVVSNVSKSRFPRSPLLRHIMSFFLVWTVLISGLFSDARAQETIQPAAPPVIVLIHRLGNFFVFASDVPFAISKAEPEISWFEVERFEGGQTAHRVVPLKSNTQGLPEGTYFSAVRVDLTTAKGPDYLLLPVVFHVGEAFEADSYPALQSDEEIPQQYIRLQPDDPNLDVLFVLTPAGHYIFEIIDKDQQNLKLQQLTIPAVSQKMQSVPESESATDQMQALSETYDIVFPWLCLEYPCGRATADDIADVEPNLDAVNHIS